MAYRHKDPYRERARREGFRSRAAYKLQEIQRSHRLLRPGQKVVDLGCWPGSWLQVAAREVGAAGRVVGVDLAEIAPPLDEANVVALRADLADPATVLLVLDALGARAHVLLCDAAPKLSGVRPTDRANEERLLEAIEGWIPELLRPGGDLLLKILEGPEALAIDRRIRSGFARAKTLRPRASPRGTAERYLLARDFRGGA